MMFLKVILKNFKRNGLSFSHNIMKKNCSVTIVDTGKKTMTGGRLKRVKDFIPKMTPLCSLMVMEFQM